MSRSGYTDDCDDVLAIGRWRGMVSSAIRGRRGQAFLREMAAAMDAMPEKVLIANELIDQDGDCCAIGSVCKARQLDVTGVDVNDRDEVGILVGIAPAMAAEIEHINDECGPYGRDETPESRWVRVRAWIDSKLKKTEG